MKEAPGEEPYFKMIDNSKGQPKLTFQWGEGLVLSFKVLTPQGGYFDPKVLYHDEHYVLFQSNTTAAKEAPTALHCLMQAPALPCLLTIYRN